MKSYFKNAAGLTLLEIMLAIGLMVIMAGLLLPVFFNLRSEKELSEGAREITAALRRAQAFSQNGTKGSKWGVYFEAPGTGQHFYQIRTYSPATTTEELFYLPPSLGFTGITSTEIIFKQNTGQTDSGLGYLVTLQLTTTGKDKKISVTKEGKIGINEAESAKIPASTTYYRYSASNCNPSTWCAITDYGGTNQEYMGELSFNLSSFAGNTVTAASICFWASTIQPPGTPSTKYVQKILSMTCAAAPSVTDVPSPTIGSLAISATGWQCIPITASEVTVGGNFYARIWGQDINAATSPYTCHYGPAQGVALCGGSNPSGAAGCHPYIDLTYY